jgi:hypothetical protein
MPGKDGHEEVHFTCHYTHVDPNAAALAESIPGEGRCENIAVPFVTTFIIYFSPGFHFEILQSSARRWGKRVRGASKNGYVYTSTPGTGNGGICRAARLSGSFLQFREGTTPHVPEPNAEEYGRDYARHAG